jgi:hypothetical protein
MGRRRLATLLAATLASGMIALPASALSVGEVTDGSSTLTDTITDTVDEVEGEVLDAGEPVLEATSTVLEETGLDEVVSPDDVADDADDLLAPVTDLFSEGEPAPPQDEQDGPAPANTTPPPLGSTRPADQVMTAEAPASNSPSTSVRPAPLPGDGSFTSAPRTDEPVAAQVAPPAPIAAPRLDMAPATRDPELAMPIAQGASDAWLKAIASLMVLGTAGIWHRAQRTIT